MLLEVLRRDSHTVHCIERRQVKKKAMELNFNNTKSVGI